MQFNIAFSVFIETSDKVTNKYYYDNLDIDEYINFKVNVVSKLDNEYTVEEILTTH